MIEKVITVTLTNFAFVLVIAALVIAFASIVRKGSWNRQSIGETTFRWLALLAVGVSGVYMAMMHIVFPEKSAATIGWATSPFQYEVGMADLTVGVLGLCAFRASYGFRLATTIAVVCWFGGDAIGHIHQMIEADNFAPGNAGSWFWTDVSLPILIVAALLASREKKVG